MASRKEMLDYLGDEIEELRVKIRCYTGPLLPTFKKRLDITESILKIVKNQALK